jgi:hypothetical protein
VLLGEVEWTAALSAIGAIVTPFAVAIIGYLISRRLKKIEDQQWRSQALTSSRLEYFREIVEPLNDLLCYFTFIGTWKEFTPPQIITIKRKLDRTFYTVSPLFGVAATKAYEDFMHRCFETFGPWGEDAKLKTGFMRRKEASHVGWEPEWEAMFTYAPQETIPEETLLGIREAYNELVARLVDDIQLTAARPDYASARIVLHAH